ncbi:GMC family oxidoreductase [Variovorax guangxiensis]|uniref:GMC family oxidoreductase n=1 Tax=Variovorax guangxiensis TaxID=1775474 RepID=A0A502DZ86_9BURK|nr:GMC family oxidoreductase [Variovorax guangxiensis]TPG27110.1 GMC family oxidoreductase [Variovorax ginsengisoli]TPG30838.1 GMC family oxidoreductase [Variovorax guangxiensis]
MATIKKPSVDAVLVGFGWTGAIMGMELTAAGLKVLALERGENRDTVPDFAYPRITDELSYGIRGKLFQNLSKETVTIRHTPADVAVPYRQHGSFLLGDGVGGAGVHWNGHHWRALPADLQLRSTYEARYGKKFIPEGMYLQDFGVSYDELEPHFDQFEKICGTSGKAGNVKGQIQAGGNPFEGWRSNEYPLPPLASPNSAVLFEKAARELGYHPFPQAAANASRAYTNPHGAQLGPCNFCGFCERYGCYMYAKAAPQTTLLPSLMKRSNFELRTRSHVQRVNMSPDGKRATGVTYIDAQGNEVEQPADLVVLCAYQMHNVRLLLLSNIGKKYDPATGEGVVGRSYAYQLNGGAALHFDKDQPMNPFVGAGASGHAMDDFDGDNFDHGPLGFVGGATINCINTGGRPIQQLSLPAGTPTWGAGWKKAAKENYVYQTSVGSQGSVMAYRDNYLDLDPTYKDAFGQPLLRMTFDWKDNDMAMTAFISTKVEQIAKAMNPKHISMGFKKKGDHYDVRPYQSTHNTGGAIMGTDPNTSAINRYLQTWDVPNVFVMGASAFPQNFGYNPTAVVAALAYWSAAAIRDKYLKNPGALA